MLLKRIDETLTQGLYDLDGGPAEVEVYLAEPSIEEGIVNWVWFGKVWCRRIFFIITTRRTAATS